MGSHGISADAVAPSTILTNMTVEAYTDENKANFLKMIPWGFVTEHEDIPPSIVFLASRQARYVNGRSMPVDGSYLAAGMMQIAFIEV